MEDEQQLQKFDARLWQPPKGEVPVQGPWTAEAETEAFNTLLAQVSGKGPTTAPSEEPVTARQTTRPVKAARPTYGLPSRAAAQKRTARR